MCVARDAARLLRVTSPLGSEAVAIEVAIKAEKNNVTRGEVNADTTNAGTNTETRTTADQQTRLTDRARIWQDARNNRRQGSCDQQ